jgi:glycosyltransferase involved in cell wall biosynthesis
MNRRLTLVCAAKLHQNQLERHLELLERLDVVERVIVVRHKPLPQRLSKLENVTFEAESLPVDMWHMYRTVRDVVRRESADWVIGLNPVPWGALGHLATRGQKTKSCLCLIGRDYQQVHGPFGFPFRRALLGADAVTVTGESMRQGVVRLGVNRARVRILPHSVDLDRFSPGDGPYSYDIVSVGQLIERKRMHVLIRALSILRDQGVRLRLGILGQGPDEAKLRALTKELELEAQVDFLAYRDDVETVLQSARVFALASAWEGVPFALMEAMAVGLVPVVTDVGTISDWVRHNQNGKLLPVDDAPAVARSISELLADDGRELRAFRKELERERARLGFDAGVGVWRDILTEGLAG